MVKLVRGPCIEARSRVFDSTRSCGYLPRADDIVVATYPKCGTTWTKIVDMLVFCSAEVRPIAMFWPDMRMLGPTEETYAMAAATTRRRVFKSSLSYDYEGVKLAVKIELPLYVRLAYQS